MKKTWDLSHTTPKAAMDWERPVLPSTSKLLVFAGASTLGSHAVRLAQVCERAFALSTDPSRFIPSDRSRRVEMIEDASIGVVQGPVQLQIVPMAATVWMARGTLIHVATAHALIQRTLQKDGTIIVCGKRFDSTSCWYSPAEAVECVAALTGPACYTYALPAARRMLPQVENWADQVVQLHQPIAVESQLCWHLNSPYCYTARFDLITQHRASAQWRGWDYKTSSNPSKDRHKYGLSAQLHGQNQMGHQWLGARWAGVVILLVEDTGKEESGKMVEVDLPQRSQARYLVSSVETALNRIAEPRFAEGNPFECGSCRVAAACAAVGEIKLRQVVIEQLEEFPLEFDFEPESLGDSG